MTDLIPREVLDQMEKHAQSMPLAFTLVVFKDGALGYVEYLQSLNHWRRQRSAEAKVRDQRAQERRSSAVR